MRDKNTVMISPLHSGSYEEIVKIPKLLVPEIDFILDHSNKDKDEFFTELVVFRFQTLLYDPESLFLFILDNSPLKERMRKGLNAYYGKEIHKQKQANVLQEKNDGVFETISFNLNIPELLNSCIEYLCKVIEWSRETLLSEFVQAQLELLYGCPEMLLDLFSDKIPFFKDLEKGLELFFNQHPINTEGVLTE